MSFASGARLGPYEISAPLGVGGMGEVYRAHDARLGRDVAIKVLPATFLADADRLHRFEQEARATAALNHPNILAVYDIGQHDTGPYIVSELLDGETLRDRLDTAALPVRRAVDFAVQIARGLSAAHEKGIAHRDLKPENLFVTADNRVKILDFGLAKVAQPPSMLSGISALPTSPPATQAGVVLGTVGYMSPEQVRGLPADHRSDIFALGAVLYEMLSGKRAFCGDTSAETMTAILKEDPPAIVAGSDQIAPSLMRVVDRCLEKNPAARFQSASDLAFALEGLSSSSGTRELPLPAIKKPRGSTMPWAAAIAALIALAVTLPFAVAHWREVPPASPVVRFAVPPPEETVFGGGGGFSPGQSVSPDGRFVVFMVNRPEPRDQILWLRSLDSLDGRPLSGTGPGGTFPFWSPDSRSIGFFTIDGKLKRVDAAGGSVQTICDASAGEGGTWNREGIVVFAPTAAGGLSRVAASGGQPVSLTKLEAGQTSHRWPWFLPDGRHFLYLVEPGNHVRIGSLDSAETTALLDADSRAVYASPGYVLFLRERTLMAQRFDGNRLSLIGDAFPVAEDVRTGNNGRASFAASDTGVLAYRTGAAPVRKNQLVWFDRQGHPLQSVSNLEDYRSVALSPDETRAVAHKHENPAGGGLWLFDLARGATSPSRFSFGDAHEGRPVWSPDSTRILFDSERPNASVDLYQNIANGTGQPTLLWKSTADKIPTSWSPDAVVYTTMSPTADIWMLPLSGEQRPKAVVETQFAEFDGKLSPDGRWLAYVSNETGQNEVYVQAFPQGSRKSKVSTTGGVSPMWRSDGNELFYLTTGKGGGVAPGQQGGGATSVMAVEFRVSNSIPQPAAPKILFEPDRVYRHGVRAPGGISAASQTYDVSRDGQRFLMLQGPPEPAQATESPMTIVLNWTASLMK